MTFFSRLRRRRRPAFALPGHREPVFKPAFNAPPPPKPKSLLSFLDASPFRNDFSDSAPARPRYAPYVPPPGVRPASESGLAQDSALPANAFTGAFWGATPSQSWIADGLGFMGYAYLAEMAQRAEFRKPCDVIARECVREWIAFSRTETSEKPSEVKSPDTKILDTKIKAIEAEFTRLNVRGVVHKAVLQGLLYGLSHIWLDIEGASQNTPLLFTPEAGLKGRLKRLVNIEPVWTAPNAYNADNPLAPDYYRPKDWWVQGTLVHASRLLSLVPYEVSDLFKPAFNFGGLSLTQQLRPYVHNYLRTRNSVANLVSNFSKLVLKTDMAARMQESMAQNGFGGGLGDAAQSVIGRAAFMRQISEGQDTIVADKENEDVSIVSAPLSGLDKLQAQAMESMASIPGIPIVKLFGIQPQGLNASSEGSIRVFYDEIGSIQEAHLRPLLEKLLQLVQLHLFGEIDPKIGFTFKPLWRLDAREHAETEKTEAETDLLNERLDAS